MESGFSQSLLPCGPESKIRAAFLFALMLLVVSGKCAAGGVLRVKAGDQTFLADVADTPAARRQGLMARKHLLRNQGLLMVLPRPQIVGVWMKDTRMALDVVWISTEGLVVDIMTLQPCRQASCPIYRPKAPARYVLEVGAGLFPLKQGEGVEIIHASGDSLFPPGVD